MSLLDKLTQQRDENRRLIRQHEDDESRIERLIGENHRLKAAQRQLEYELYFNDSRFKDLRIQPGKHFNG